VEKNPNYNFAWRGLAAALTLSGQIDAARDALAEMLRIEPDFTIAALLARTPSATRRFVPIITALRQLGVPEQ
jgi:hypothetical protein